MSNYIATVIKTGNSYALRVPKAYMEAGELKLGQKVQLGEPELAPRAFNHEAFIEAMKAVQELNPYRDIEDPVAWQRETRKDRPLPGRD
jgi:antitoxin component of MazEF toxin-antitoxin module